MAAVKKHLEERNQKKTRITDLKESIANNEQAIIGLEKDYKNAVADDSANIDDIFHEMEALQKKIRADKHKLTTLEGVTDEHLKNNALKVLEGYEKEIIAKYDERAEEIMQKVEQAKKAYIQAVNEINQKGIQLNKDFRADTSRYWNLVNIYNLDKKEVNAISSNFYNRLENARHGVGYTPYTANYGITSQDIQKGVNE